MQMPGRTFSGNGIGGSDYKYSFNGKEDDKSSGWFTQDYGYRNYDNRLGRFFSQDPLFRQYPELTPYQFASNTPIQAIDRDGLEAESSTGGSGGSGNGGTTGGNGSSSTGGGNYQSHSVRAPSTNLFSTNRFFERGSASSAVAGTSAFGSFAGTPRPLFIPALPWIWGALEALFTVGATDAAIGTGIGVFTGALKYEGTDDGEKRNWIVYQIQYNTVGVESGEISAPNTYKFGISGQIPNPNGSHPRPETQVSKLNRDEMLALAEGDFFDYRIYTPIILGTKLTQLEAEYLEQALVNGYYSIHGQQPEGNKRPLADPLKRSRRKKFEKVTKEFKDKIFKMMTSGKK